MRHLRSAHEAMTKFETEVPDVVRIHVRKMAVEYATSRMESPFGHDFRGGITTSVYALIEECGFDRRDAVLVFECYTLQAS